ncbi:MAG: Maf-like protein [Spirochaetaceae bacterium]|nr:MAG: Maf-like protein [Spirochaetaceae bacterium]
MQSEKPGTDTTLPRVTLASASPRRREILGRLGLEFVVRAADAPEESVSTATVQRFSDPHETCRRVTLERARLKAASVAPDPSTTVALAADTTVDAGGILLDKPADEAEARFMMQHLSGTTHQVHSAVILYDDPTAPDRWLEEIVTSHVTFHLLAEEDLTWYFRHNGPEEPEWVGVAGGYRIQGRAGAFVQHLQGSYEAVMGLPIHTVYSMIRRFFHPDKS